MIAHLSHPRHALMVAVGLLLAILPLPFIPKGLDLPPGRAGLFGVLASVVALAVFAVMLARRRSSSRGPRAAIFALSIAGALLVSSLIGYLVLERLCIVRTDTDDPGGGEVALFPVFLSGRLGNAVQMQSGNRSLALHRYSQDWVTNEAANYPFAIIGSLALLLGCYVMIFASIAAAGAVCIDTFTDDPTPRGFAVGPPLGPPPQGAIQVFISHATEDGAHAARVICTALEEKGIRCWIAPRDVTAGKLWAEMIVDAIAQCKVIVLIVTPTANKSKYVVREVERGMGAGLTLIPLRLGGVKPAGALGLFLGAVHHLSASDPPLPQEVADLVRSVEMTLGSQPSSASRVNTSAGGSSQPTPENSPEDPVDQAATTHPTGV